MEFGRLWVLRGPNIWARVPVIEVEVETDASATGPTDLGERLAHRLAILKNSPELGARLRETGAEELRRAPTLAHALQHLRLELQCLAGSDVSFGATCAGVKPGQWRVAVEYDEEPLGHA